MAASWSDSLVVVGAACLAVMAVFVPVSIYSWPVMLLSAFLSSLMLSLIGIAGGLWSEKFDHMATITNFIVTPLSFLSGTFYSLSRLPEMWQKVALYNPYFHMSASFRYGMIGHADAPLMTGILMLVGINLALCALCYRMLATGYKIKA
jgi:ABC-2 type transport system permease protein